MTLRDRNVFPTSVLTVMALSRKAIWTQVMKRKILGLPLQIYTTLELNNRIIFLYGKMDYHLPVGYTWQGWTSERLSDISDPPCKRKS